MDTIIAFFVGMMVGGFFGLCITAILVASKDE